MIYSEKAWAKINLLLHVGNRYGSKSYHLLESIYCPITVCDKLEVEISESDKFNINLQVSLSSKLKSHLIASNRNEVEYLKLLSSEKNLIIKIITLIREKFLDKFNRINLNIKLEKFIPDQAGLGGGSSDAAAVARILQKHFSLPIEEVLNLISEVGDDVVPCYSNNPTYHLFDENRLKEFELPKKLETKKILLIKPNIGSDTKFAFNSLNRPHSASYPKSSVQNIFMTNQFISEGSMDDLYNDFQMTIFKQIPVLESAYHFLKLTHAEKIQLTGSGTTLFAIYKNNEDLSRALLLFSKEFGATWWIEECDFLKSSLEPIQLS